METSPAHRSRFWGWALLWAGLQSAALWGQNSAGSLSGRITEAGTGEPLPGAAVTLVGSYKGAAADFDGRFVIEGIKPGDYTVKVQAIGFATQEHTGVRIAAGQALVKNFALKPTLEALNEVQIIGRQNPVNLELAATEVNIGKDQISRMNVRDVQEVVAMQAGVVKTTDGLQIRGARVYETEYLVDGISAQDPLAGTGFGVDVSSGSIEKLSVTTGGVGAEFGGGSSGLINTQIRGGGEQFEMSGSWQTDHLFGQGATAFNTDIVELNVGTPLDKAKKIRFFTGLTVRLTDEYFGPTADQLHSSLFSADPEFWAPRNTNSFSHSLKLELRLKPGTTLSLTNQHSLNINQNTRTLQIVGFDAILRPGFQYEFSNDLDNATTYTHHSNLTAFNWRQVLDKQWVLNASLGRLFTNLRADANGRPFRYETVDQIFDPAYIITYPIQVFNPGDPTGIYYVSPGDGLYNNGGIGTLWHDHYASEYSVKASFDYVPNSVHQVKLGIEHQFSEYQWTDVTRPWVGAPIAINDSVSTPSISVGSSNDLWKVQPQEGGLFVQDKIVYKGIIATLGVRLNYWAPGQFADDAVANPSAPVLDAVRTGYNENTLGAFGLRWKVRLLPKINVSFPVTENNVLFFNYGHSMRLPHPRFVYAGLDPVYQDRGFLASLGNPDLNPEVNVSYEIGFKTQFTRDFGMSFSAYNNNRFDYIVSRRVIVNDQTGRPTTKTMYINQDYARILGVEVGLFYRLDDRLGVFANAAYQSARGKSNSARESALQIEQNGEVELTREQYLAFDRPITINAGASYRFAEGDRVWGLGVYGLEAFLSFNYTSGFRYTPQVKVGENELGRPEYQEQNDRYLESLATPWVNFDYKMSYAFRLSKTGTSALVLGLEIRNLLDARNAQIINPVTGRAYEYGDDVPNNWRDPRPEYNGPLETGVDPRNPARYLAPRQILYSLGFRF
ncbi:TonB-dependent receptor [bacterium]|nr:TonB-dependent receptor [bacterium]